MNGVETQYYNGINITLKRQNIGGGRVATTAVVQIKARFDEEFVGVAVLNPEDKDNAIFGCKQAVDRATRKLSKSEARLVKKYLTDALDNDWIVSRVKFFKLNIFDSLFL